jgi:hypothetical protein
MAVFPFAAALVPSVAVPMEDQDPRDFTINGLRKY